MSYINEKTLSTDRARSVQHLVKHSVKFLQCVTMITHPSLFLQVYADDVLTKEEQIGLLFRAKQKCESIIKAKHKIHGEQRLSNDQIKIIMICTANTP